MIYRLRSQMSPPITILAQGSTEVNPTRATGEGKCSEGKMCEGKVGVWEGGGEAKRSINQ